MGFVWFLIIVLAVVAALPFWLERQRAPMGKAARKAAPGSFATLSQGVTHYRWHGPARGPVLVAIHGLIAPSAVWDIVAAGFGGMGYRVLTYDLYGRGYSDAPDGPQDEAFFLQQLEDLLEDQGLTEDLTMVGYSMGGAIATAFTHASAHRVKRLILMATAGVEMNESKFARFCRETPILGDWLHGLLGTTRMRQSIATDFAQSDIDTLKATVSDQLRQRGFLKAVLSSRRGMLDTKQKAAHQAIGRLDIPTIAIWAEQDKVIPLSALGTLTQWNRNVRQETIPDAGHGLPHTHTSALIEKLRELLVEKD